MTNELMYISLKNDIMRKIYEGIYEDGCNIPSERDLSDTYKMSRDTVRKALDILERDGVIHRRLGKGTVVSLNKHGYKGNLDIIALVAPAHRRFFATFIGYFQKIADKNNSLVVFVQQSEQEPIKDTLFKLLLNNIHNVVIWLDYETISEDYIKRLRGLGMNIVFFDITVNSPYADSVCLDNRDAVYSLYHYVVSRNKKSIAYVTRENTDPSSYYERERAFLELSPSSIVWCFPWDFKNYIANNPDKFTFDYFYRTYKPSCVICSDGELGTTLKKSLIKKKINDVLLVTLDDFEDCEELGITSYKQPFDLFAEKVYQCLMEQSFNSLTWKANVYRLKGQLIVRE